MTMLDQEMLKTGVRVVRIGLVALAPRILTFAALLITAAFFGWAMYLQTPLALGAAAAFAVVVFLPVLGRDKKESPES